MIHWAAGIAACILQNLDLWQLPNLDGGHPLLSDPLPAVSAAYYGKLAQLCYRGQAANASAEAVVYTPLHGVGTGYALKAFQVPACWPHAFEPSNCSNLRLIPNLSVFLFLRS